MQRGRLSSQRVQLVDVRLCVLQACCTEQQVLRRTQAASLLVCASAQSARLLWGFICAASTMIMIQQQSNSCATIGVHKGVCSTGQVSLGAAAFHKGAQSVC